MSPSIESRASPVAQRFFAANTYKVQVCERCQRQAEFGAAGDACAFEGCEGTLMDLVVVPLSVARTWRLQRNAADEKVEKLHAELVDTFELPD